ncbi:hypothetical protein SCLCIDRAFT_26188 [Scleroderma citrinum Foug A]|uniref:Uncharacterized protein n=1 Tax=Scleroderma citrinum Foug A TaxID=1036808 RepID=A0A0C3A854_9AGAM|nr:hypothetical protein SCLCIDRAFT_26188 [Scleroderma citrinum Foug A]
MFENETRSNFSNSPPAALLPPSLGFSTSEHVGSSTMLDTSTTQTMDAERLGGSSHPVRSRRLPAQFRDILPEPSLPPLSINSETQSESHISTSQSMLPHVILHVFDSFRTSFNRFGIARYYCHRPSYDPDAFLTLNQLSNATNEHPTVGLSGDIPDIPSIPPAPPWPWKNMGIWRLMTWMLMGSGQKSEAEVTRLVHEVIQAEDFDRTHFHGFNAHTEMNRFDKSEDATSVDLQDGWKESPVDILVPTREQNPDGNGQPFTIPGLFHRSLTSVIRAVFAEKAAKWFHLTPFKQIWKSPATSQEQCLYNELYTSDAWITAHDDLQKQQRDDGCTLECSMGQFADADATHLAQFGHASAWPVYLFFGNQSKYVRARPNSGTCHPIAFIPTLPETIVQFASTIMKKKALNDILTHCKRELFHGVWKVLLDKEFIEAYRNGIVIKCYDGKYRYKSFFVQNNSNSLGAHRVLLATIQDKGHFPCPRCLIPKKDFHLLGFLTDLSQRMSRARLYIHDKVSAARNAIYNLGSPIKGTLPEGHLKDTSLVPTFNAFADNLGSLGCDVYRMLVVDLLHEFELGIFKSVFRHLLRLLYTIDPGMIAVLNGHFHQIPLFGKGAIHWFPPNVSEVHQCAARHFEDILQCAIPVFEGLFPANHGDVIRKLLFRLAQWHALAKLCLHTDESLNYLDRVT